MTRMVSLLAYFTGTHSTSFVRKKDPTASAGLEPSALDPRSNALAIGPAHLSRILP